MLYAGILVSHRHHLEALEGLEEGCELGETVVPDVEIRVSLDQSVAKIAGGDPAVLVVALLVEDGDDGAPDLFQAGDFAGLLVVEFVLDGYDAQVFGLVFAGLGILFEGLGGSVGGGVLLKLRGLGKQADGSLFALLELGALDGLFVFSGVP